MVTLSIGLTKQAAGDTVESMINRADQAVYAAKGHGRNCLMVIDSKDTITQWPTGERIERVKSRPEDNSPRPTETRSRQKR